MDVSNSGFESQTLYCFFPLFLLRGKRPLKRLWGRGRDHELPRENDVDFPWSDKSPPDPDRHPHHRTPMVLTVFTTTSYLYTQLGPFLQFFFFIFVLGRPCLPTLRSSLRIGIEVDIFILTFPFYLLFSSLLLFFCFFVSSFPLFLVSVFLSPFVYSLSIPVVVTPLRSHPSLHRRRPSHVRG